MARDEALTVRPDCCGAQLVALCGARPCTSRFCCSCCPSVKESRTTKCIYSLILVVATSLMAAMMVPSIQHQLQAVFRDFNATCTDLKIGRNCMKLTGYMAAYKISFSFTLFFLTLALLTLGITSSKGARAFIHNGLWFFKLLVVLSLLVAIFVVPISHLDQLHSAYIYTSLVGNWIFILLQVVALIDFSNAVCSFVQRFSSAHSIWRAIELALAIAVISIWLVVSILLFLIHGQQDFCLTKQLSLILNTGFCICLLLTALTPCARRPSTQSELMVTWQRQQSIYASQLVQSGLVSIYMTYWVWSAMQSAPETPGFVELTFFLDEDDLVCYMPRSFIVEESLTYTAIFMMLFTLAYVGSSWSEVKQPKLSSAHLHKDTSSTDHIIKDEAVRTTYSYSLLHLILALSTMFATTQLTRWFHPNDYTLYDLDRSWATVALKVACAWSCGLLYLLYLLLPDRCRLPRFCSFRKRRRHDSSNMSPRQEQNTHVFHLTESSALSHM